MSTITAKTLKFRWKAGVINRTIWSISLPAFAALIAEPLMFVVDTAIIGHLGTVELAAVAAGQSVIGAILALSIFLAYGTTATVSRHIGARDSTGAWALAVSGLWLSIIWGLIIALLVAIFSEPLLAPFVSSPQTAHLAKSYLLISTLGLVGMFLFLAATGALRGVLDLKTPLLVVVVSNLLNAALALLFVYGFGWSVPGAAWATVIAQSAGGIYLASRVIKHASESGAALSPNIGEIINAAKQGVALIIRSASLQATFLIATMLAAGIGDVSLASHRIAISVVTLLAFSLDAIAIAGQTLTGRFLGAGDLQLLNQYKKRLMQWGITAGAIAALTLLATREYVPFLFTTDADVIKALFPVLTAIALLQPISGLVFVLDGILIGASDTKYLAVAMLISFLAYLPMAFFAQSNLTYLWLAYCGFIIARLITLLARIRTTTWQRVS